MYLFMKGSLVGWEGYKGLAGEMGEGEGGKRFVGVERG